MIFINKSLLFSFCYIVQAKIFGIPIHSWAVYSAMVLTAYVMFILIQTNNYSLFDPAF